MLLTDLPKHVNCEKIYNAPKRNIEFKHIYTNSKSIKRLSIYAINNKKKITYSYIKEAIQNGSVAILSNKYLKRIKLPQYIVQDLDININKLLNKLLPFKPINSIGVTGTNGKTSVTWFVSQICLSNKVPLKTYGTLGYFINAKKKHDSILTTPEYEILHQSSFSRIKNLYNFIFEVSSHALKQKRIRNFPINVAAITNLTHDHLDYHKSFQKYKNAKLQLFTKYLVKNGTAVLNDKLKGVEKLKEKLSSKNKIITYGLPKSDINIVNRKKITEVKIYKKKYSLDLINFSLVDLENIACSIACSLELNIKIKDILDSLKKIKKPPGRLEEVENKDKNFKVYVDYAHTPDALKKVLISQTINKKKPNVVFGCGGNRDKEKRTKMGLIANKYANLIYVTDDNPRHENPEKIRKSILKNCKKGIEIPDRKQAIKKAIEDLKKNDILIIAGKGHEKKQINKFSIKLFDDVKIAKIEIKKKII